MFHVAYKSLINLFKVIEPKSPKMYMIEKKIMKLQEAMRKRNP